MGNCSTVVIIYSVNVYLFTLSFCLISPTFLPDYHVFIFSLVMLCRSFYFGQNYHLFKGSKFTETHKLHNNLYNNAEEFSSLNCSNEVLLQMNHGCAWVQFHLNKSCHFGALKQYLPDRRETLLALGKTKMYAWGWTVSSAYVCPYSCFPPEIRP